MSGPYIKHYIHYAIEPAVNFIYWKEDDYSIMSLATSMVMNEKISCKMLDLVQPVIANTGFSKAENYIDMLRVT